MQKTNRREFGQKILASDKSDDQKLLEVFELYKDDLREQYPNLYYALLGWRNAHLRELNLGPEAEEVLREYFK